jgi:hypothetical protein
LNTLTVLRLDRDRDLTGDIVPEAYFRCVAVRELAYPWATYDAERQLTEIRAAWTDKFLYLHLWAKDSWVTAEDRLSVHLQRGENEYTVWEGSASGALTAYKASGWNGESGLQFDRGWKSAAQTKIRVHDAGWVWELRIPFAKDLGDLPHRGDSWSASFHRTDVDRRGRTSLSTFSELNAEAEANFHQPAGFGQLVFG